MVYSTFKSLRPPPPSPMPPGDKAKKSQHPAKDKVAGYVSHNAQAPGTATISPMPTPKNTIKVMASQLLTPVPGGLTPAGHGRIKAPPLCTAPSLKRVASTAHDFSIAGVCFSPEEAESCAHKARSGSEDVSDSVPLTVEQCNPPDFAAAEAALASSLTEGKPFLSSNSSVVTTSSSSSSSETKEEPPLEVVGTGLNVTVDGERPQISSAVSEDTTEQLQRTSTAAKALPQTTAPLPSRASSSALSSTFTDNLIKGNSSRQGRSLQRWLVHAPTEALVRQVAGTIPITRDGRIILASASRKQEWILPKGGWDEDETKEECAVRETFEEAGLLGRLGGCLGPIDYETRKAKKRRSSKLNEGSDAEREQSAKKEPKIGDCETPDPRPKRAKYEASAANPRTGLSLASSAIPASASASATPATPLDPAKYSHVRLLLFPLYVTTVKADWPEKGRLRKLVDIDEAIEIMDAENRLYFKRGLELVKERGLHLLKPEIAS
ncbi:hypothetical protein ACHAXT_011460 [Thalassiosira profunda]